MNFKLPDVFNNPLATSVIALDWDDTINATFLSLRKAVVAAGYPVPPEHVYLTTANTNGGLDVALADGGFMRERIARGGDQKLTQIIMRLQKAGTAVGICTHRGFHKDAMELSKGVFDSLGWTPNFIYILDPAKTPDKVAFLTEHYGDNFTLVDDRPRWDAKHALPSQVWLMDQPWNQDIPVSHPYCRISGLEDLADKLFCTHNELCNPKVVHKLTGRWTMDDEIRLARWKLFFDRDPGPEFAELRRTLARQNITPSMLGSARETIQHQHANSSAVGGFNREKKLLRLLNARHIVPIDLYDSNEWVPVGKGYDVAIRQDGMYRQAVMTQTDDITPQFTLGVRTAILKADGYATNWVVEREEVIWEPGPSKPEYLLPMTPPAAYNCGGETMSSREHAVAWAQEERAKLFTRATGGASLVDPVTGGPLPTQFSAALTYVMSDRRPGTILAIMQLLYHWNTEGDEHGNWDSFYSHYKILYPESYAIISPYLTGGSEPVNEPKSVVHFIQMDSGVYLVNTKEGHESALSEWADARWMEKRPLAEQECGYPALLNLVATSATTYHSTLIPLGEITRAISVVGLN